MANANHNDGELFLALSIQQLLRNDSVLLLMQAAEMLLL
jgi:hypothetical protein